MLIFIKKILILFLISVCIIILIFPLWAYNSIANHYENAQQGKIAHGDTRFGGVPIISNDLFAYSMWRKGSLGLSLVPSYPEWIFLFWYISIREKSPFLFNLK